MNSDQDPAVGRWLLWTGVGALLILQALLLHQAFHGGEFTRSIPWDDCSILDLALLRLARATGAESLFGLVLMAQDLAPHSPVADIQSMLGYLLSGGQTWGPYLLNSLPLILGMLVVWPALRQRSPWVAAALLILLVFQPITVYGLTNLKADWKGGFLAALSIFMFFEALTTGLRSRWIAASALLGAAVLCKLTAFYQPPLALIVLGLFHAAAVLQGEPVADCKREHIQRSIGSLFRDLVSRWRAILTDAALVVGPYALFFLYGSHSHFNTIKYIKHALSTTWTDGLTWSGRVALYGPVLNPAWGPLAWLLPVLAVLAALAFWRRRDLTLLQPVWLGFLAVGVFFAPLTFAKTSNIEFGGTFLGICLGTTLVLIARLGSLSRSAGVLALGLALLGALFTSFEPYRRQLTPDEQVAQAEAVRTYGVLVEKIRALRNGADVTVNVFYEDSLVPHPNLGLMYFARTGRRLNTTRFDELPQDAEASAQAGGANFSLVLSPAAGSTSAGYMPWPESWTTTHQVATQAFVRALPNTILQATFPWKNGRIELYRHLGTDAARPAALAPAE